MGIVPPNMLVEEYRILCLPVRRKRMVIDKTILDELTAKAKENPRLRCNDMVPGGGGY